MNFLFIAIYITICMTILIIVRSFSYGRNKFRNTIFWFTFGLIFFPVFDITMSVLDNETYMFYDKTTFEVPDEAHFIDEKTVIVEEEGFYYHYIFDGENWINQGIFQEKLIPAKNLTLPKDIINERINNYYKT